MTEYPNIAINMVTTDRLTVCVREVAERIDGRPVVFIHGNISSSPFFFPLMNDLPAQIRPIALDLRGFGGTETKPVDATRGLRDFADDCWSALDALGLEVVDLVGWSMGGGVVMQMAIDRPAAVSGLTLINPVSPYGFGGTVGTTGQPVADASGSGGGGANPNFVEAIGSGDASDLTPNSPRSVLRAFYVAPGWDGAGEDSYVASMLSTATGADNYPGDSAPSPQWPGFAPGDRGVLNTMSPNHLDLTAITDIEPKSPILWIRGALDQIVSDASMFDLAQLGALGVVPGYPGIDTLPPQPMVAQTRAVLDRYAASGGRYREVVIEGAGHSPHIEKLDEVVAALREHLGF